MINDLWLHISEHTNFSKVVESRRRRIWISPGDSVSAYTPGNWTGGQWTGWANACGERCAKYRQRYQSGIQSGTGGGKKFLFCSWQTFGRAFHHNNSVTSYLSSPLLKIVIQMLTEYIHIAWRIFVVENVAMFGDWLKIPHGFSLAWSKNLKFCFLLSSSL